MAVERGSWICSISSEAGDRPCRYVADWRRRRLVVWRDRTIRANGASQRARVVQADAAVPLDGKRMLLAV